MTMTVHVENQHQSSRPVFITHETEVPIYEAKLAAIFVEKWGLIAGAPDGEDSTGRSKIRLLTPIEVVERACATAAILVNEFRHRGWFVTAPSWDEAKEIASNAAADDFANEFGALSAAKRAADIAAARSAASDTPKAP